MDIAIKECLQRQVAESTECELKMREASSPKIRFALLVELLKSKRLINDQVLRKILFNSMPMSRKQIALEGIKIYVMQEMVH